jgi:hypothetical protein
MEQSMSQQKPAVRYVPRELLFILAAIVPVALLCNTVSHLRDPHPAPESMTPQAIDARLKPVAHVFATADEVKLASAGSAPTLKN